MKKFNLEMIFFIIMLFFLSTSSKLDIKAGRILSKDAEKISKSQIKKISIIPNKTIIVNSQGKSNQDKYKIYCGKLTRGVLKEKTPQTQRKVLVPTVYGFNMYVDRKDAFGSNIIQKEGYHYLDNIKQIGYMVNPGNTVLNVGSQTGEQALVMAKIVGPKGKLFVVQPYWFSNDLITSSIKYNNFSNYTTIYKKGASDQKGTSVISVRFFNTGFSLINDKYKEQLKKNETLKSHSDGEFQLVELDTIDNMLPKDVSIDFALIDVERMQAKVLTGMKEVIKRSPNIIMMVEWMNFDNNPGISMQYRRQILQYLIDNGFGIYISPQVDKKTCQIKKFTRAKSLDDILSNKQWRDLFFIPLKHQIWKKVQQR